MTLLELMIYITLLTVIGGLVLNIFSFQIVQWGYARILRDSSDGGKFILDRLIQEIELARSVETSTSVLNAHPGKLVLNTFASATSSQEALLEIFVDNGELKIKRGTGPATSLSGARIEVTQLIFRRISSVKSEMVRVELTVKATSGSYAQEQSFVTASVLRGSY